MSNDGVEPWDLASFTIRAFRDGAVKKFMRTSFSPFVPFCFIIFFFIS